MSSIVQRFGDHPSIARIVTAAKKKGELDAAHDIALFSRLQSWYKHLTKEGVVFYATPWLGLQPKGSATELMDPDQLHWHFWTPEQMYRMRDHMGLVVFEAALQHPIRFTNVLGNGQDQTEREAASRSCAQIWKLLTLRVQ